MLLRGRTWKLILAWLYSRWTFNILFFCFHKTILFVKNFTFRTISINLCNFWFSLDAGGCSFLKYLFLLRCSSTSTSRGTNIRRPYISWIIFIKNLTFANILTFPLGRCKSTGNFTSLNMFIFLFFFFLFLLIIILRYKSLYKMFNIFLPLRFLKLTILTILMIPFNKLRYNPILKSNKIFLYPFQHILLPLL